MRKIKRILRFSATNATKLSGFLRLAWLKSTTIGLSCGSRVSVGKNCDIKVTDAGTCQFEDDVNIAQNTVVTVRGGHLKLGNRSFVGQGSILVAQSYISIGADCLIAEYVTIRDQDHKFAAGQKTSDNGFLCAPISIGDNVWIGAKATILKGVLVGNNSVIAAGAVVTKDVPDNTIAKGVPARMTAITSEQILNVETDRAAAA